jgi:hypothetical protein
MTMEKQAMSRLSTIARRARYRKPPPQEQQLPAIPAYRDRLDHLADAGGAYLVLPYGLLNQLSAEQQLQLIHIVEDVARINPQWVSNTTYQVLHWARVHPADLSTEELTWHGITSDIDPSTGTVAYNRGGKPLSPGTIVGHRPAPDATPAPPGTHPGARPALLPAAPGLHFAGMTPATSRRLRTNRAERVIETRRRREVLFQRAPTGDPQWVEAIIAADPLWGPDEDWKLLIDQSTTQADLPAPPPRPNQVDSDEAIAPQAPPDDPEPISTADKHEAELAALEADLQDLFHP